jgi:hypothetical protein
MYNDAAQVDATDVENGEAICLIKGSEAAADSQVPTITPFGRAFYENEANYPVTPYVVILMTNIFIISLSALYSTMGPTVTIQVLRQLEIHYQRLNIFGPQWQSFIVLYASIAVCFIVAFAVLACGSILLLICSKWTVIGQRHEGQYDWDKSNYNQRWQLYLTLHIFLFAGYGTRGVLAPLSGSVYIVWYLRALGAKIGKNCFIYAGHKIGFMTEPDLVEVNRLLF